VEETARVNTLLNLLMSPNLVFKVIFNRNHSNISNLLHVIGTAKIQLISCPCTYLCRFCANSIGLCQISSGNHSKLFTSGKEGCGLLIVYHHHPFHYWEMLQILQNRILQLL